MIKQTLFLLAAGILLQGSSEKAETILQKADEIRAPSYSYQMVVSVESEDGDRYEYQLNIGGKDASLIRTLAPSRDVGKNFLMNGEQMWAYLPNIRRSVRVTLNQKLVGQAANGDISRMRWFGDYDAAMEAQDEKSWTLLLTAKKSGLTYDKIRVWIDKATYRPMHGEYLTKAGKVLKKVEFSEYKEIAGNLRPSKITIRSATQEGKFSVLRIEEMREKTFSNAFFRKASLR